MQDANRSRATGEDGHSIEIPQWLLHGLQGFLVYLAILGSFRVGFASNYVVAVWPAAGIMLWMALYSGARAFPAMVAGNLAFNFLHQSGEFTFFLVTASINALAAVLAGWAYRRCGGTDNPLGSMQGIGLLLLVFALGMSLLAAAAGGSYVGYALGLSSDDTWRAAWRWFFSDFTGAVLVAPALIGVCGAARTVNPKRLRRRLETLALPALSCATVLTILVWASAFMPEALGQYPTVLFTLPLCVWLAMRRDSPSSMLLLGLTIVGALVITLSTLGDVSEAGFLAVQLYGLVAMCTSLMIHASATERRQALTALAVERHSLEDAIAERTRELREQIAAKEQMTRMLEQLARTDPLTELPNRREFMERAQDELRRMRRFGGRLSLVMLDMDHFKSINDRFGHAGGDAALVAVARVLRGTIRDRIDLVARLGGEEFACLLPETSLEQAMLFAERLRQELGAIEVRFDQHRFSLTASLGVAEVGRDSTIDKTLQAADHALYRAKAAGRNRVEMHEGEFEGIAVGGRV